MLIKELKLKNFRQFAGESSALNISCRPLPGVTLFHGEMGHGKTTILNAFRWVLHGRRGVSDRFTDSDSIVNRYVAEKDSSAEASVSLVFTQKIENEGEMHVSVRRTVTPRQQLETVGLSANCGDLEVITVNRSIPDSRTNTYSGPEAQNFINSMIPEGILDILFFDGEGIDKLMEDNQSESMADAVRNILGFSVIERAIEDLNHSEVLGHFEGERDESAGEDLSVKYEERRMIERQISDSNKTLNDFKEEKDRLDLVIKGIQAKLDQYREVASLIKDQDDLGKNIAKDQQLHAKALVALTVFMRKHASSIVSARLLTEGARLEKRFRDEGKFPAPITSAYVNELLESGKCLCGRPLDANTPEHNHVKSALSFARDSRFHETASSVAKVLADLDANTAERRLELEGLRDSYILIDREISKNEARLKAIQAELAVFGHIEVKALELQFLDAGGSLRHCKDEISKLEGERLPELRKKSDNLDTLIRNLEIQSAQSALMAQRVEVIKKAISRLEELLSVRAERVEHRLNEIVNRKFQQLTDIEGMACVIRKPRAQGKADAFIPEIRIKNLNGEWIPEKGVNTGRRQCLSLAFISGLVELAAHSESFDDNLGAYFPSNDFPVVMDAPFGVLDSVSSAKLARSLPDFASQVICLINYASYSNIKMVIDASGVVGKRYVLFHAYDPHEVRERRTVDILGLPVCVAGPAENGAFVHSEVLSVTS